jgi:hypothetical protein
VSISIHCITTLLVTMKHDFLIVVNDSHSTLHNFLCEDWAPVLAAQIPQCIN